MRPPALDVLPRSRALLAPTSAVVKGCNVIVALGASAVRARLAELVCAAALHADLLAVEFLEIVIVLAVLTDFSFAAAAVGDSGLGLAVHALLRGRVKVEVVRALQAFALAVLARLAFVAPGALLALVAADALSDTSFLHVAVHARATFAGSEFAVSTEFIGAICTRAPIQDGAGFRAAATVD